MWHLIQKLFCLRVICLHPITFSLSSLLYYTFYLNTIYSSKPIPIAISPAPAPASLACLSFVGRRTTTTLTTLPYISAHLSHRLFSLTNIFGLFFFSILIHSYMVGITTLHDTNYVYIEEYSVTIQQQASFKSSIMYICIGIVYYNKRGCHRFRFAYIYVITFISRNNF